MRWRRRAAGLALPLLLAPLACPRPARDARDPRAPCATLDAAACARARGLVAAASAYADEQHDYVLASTASLKPGVGLAQTAEGWRALPTACAREVASPPRIDAATIAYAFVGVVVDGTLVSADADIGLLLGRAEPAPHDVRLVAMAFVRSLGAPTFEATTALDMVANGEGCSCAGATHFAAGARYGALLGFDFRAPRSSAPVRAIDFVRAALGDPRFTVRESRVGALTVSGLDAVLADPRASPRFGVTAPALVAYEAAPLRDLCDFATPEVSPSPLDFGVAPYGTEVTRSVHVVNRSPIDLQALLGARTVLVPARGAIDLPLRWAPTGDAPGCETQTRDESIPFLRASRDPARASSAPNPRTARVLETVRTGRATVQRAEHVEPAPAPASRGRPSSPDHASTVRDVTCPPDFVRTACRIENPAAGYDVVAEPRGDDGCHFACRGRRPGPAGPVCRFDAVVDCALHCPR